MGPDPARGREASPQRTAWTADELMAEHFPPVRWAVPGLIAEGVNLLAGPPKVGKSWLSLGLALSVAAGNDALGSVPVQAGAVLYLALEDTPRRLQSRMGKLLDGRAGPRGLTLATTCPPLPEGGAAAIGNWLDRNPAARLIVVDVFAKVRGRPPMGVSAYDADAGIWVLAATTGMRRSELAHTERELLDLDNVVLEIGDTRVVVDGKAEESDGKTESGRRVISLDPLTVAYLRRHLAMLDTEKEAFGDSYHDGGWLVCHPDGRPVHPDTITDRFNKLVDGRESSEFASTTCGTPTPRPRSMLG